MSRLQSCAKLGKCHFVVKERIVLGHCISEKRIEVDRTKVDALERLLPPISLKGVRSFIGHAGFYRSFIKDFLKIAHPWLKLLQKECKFYFDESCLKVVWRVEG